jgi:hypothetical protein
MSKWLNNLGLWTSRGCGDHYYAVMACLDGVAKVAKEGQLKNEAGWVHQCQRAVRLFVNDPELINSIITTLPLLCCLPLRWRYWEMVI